MAEFRGQAGSDQARGDEGANRANWFYEQLMNNPGLTPEERAGILQAQRRGYLLNEGDAANNYLTPDEQAQIVGNSGSWMPGYADRYNEIASAMDTGRDGIRSIRERGAGAMRGVNEASRGELGGILGRLDDRLQEAAGRGDLRLTDGFESSLRGAAEGGTAAGRGVIGGTRGNLDGVTDNMAMREGAYDRIANVDEAAIEGAAGRAAGAQNSRVLKAITQKAMATGQGNPLTLAEALKDLAVDGSLEAGKARADARVMAGREGRQAMAAAEGMRLDSAGNRARVLSGNELALMQAGLENENAGAGRLLSALSAGENMRLDSARDRSDRAMRAGATSGQAALNTAEGQAARQLQTENTIAGRDLDSETGLNSQRLGWMDSANRYFTDAGRESEDTNARRQALVAGNRQATTQGNQATRYGQGMGIANADQNSWQQVAGARRGDEAEGRGYYANTGQFYSGQAQRGRGQALDAFGTGAGVANQAQGQANQAAAAPKWWERAINTGVGVAGALQGSGGGGKSGGGGILKWFGAGAQGGVISEPSTAILGEDGPEMIVPLRPGMQATPLTSMNMLQRIMPSVMEAGPEMGQFDWKRKMNIKAQPQPRLLLAPLG